MRVRGYTTVAHGTLEPSGGGLRVAIERVAIEPGGRADYSFDLEAMTATVTVHHPSLPRRWWTTFKAMLRGDRGPVLVEGD
jgi:hypothetical protein